MKSAAEFPGRRTLKLSRPADPPAAAFLRNTWTPPVDYDSLGALGAIMGSGGMIVMDEDTCMVDIAKFFIDFCVDESCGKCSPCRIGTKRMLEILERITNGEGREGDIELLEELAKTIKSTALCGLGQTAPNPCIEHNPLLQA